MIDRFTSRKEANSPMDGLGIVGIVVLVLVVALVAISSGDIARYLKMRSM